MGEHGRSGDAANVGGDTVLKTFFLGVIIGVATVWSGFYFYQPIDVTREKSVVKLVPNGINEEVFRINVPRDVVLNDNPQNPTPVNLDWSSAAFLGDTQVNLFKVRDVNGRVVGVASRIVNNDVSEESVSEWLLHLPARGNLYVVMSGKRTSDGGYEGRIQEGTGDFEGRVGLLTERFLKDAGLATEPESAIELLLMTSSAEQQ